MVLTGEETLGSVLGSVAALGKQHNWGLKQKHVSPQVWQAVLSQRPLLASADSRHLGLWSYPSNPCLHCYVASSCVSVFLPLRRTHLWVLGYQDNPG